MHARPYVSLEDLLQRKCLLRHGLLAIESFLGIISLSWYHYSSIFTSYLGSRKMLDFVWGLEGDGLYADSESRNNKTPFPS